MIDDDAPTPRPFTIDPRLREQLTRPAEPSAEASREDEYRPAEPRPYERLSSDSRPRRPVPESPQPAQRRSTSEGALGSRLASRRRLGQQAVQAPPPDDEPAGGSTTAPEAPRATAGDREPAGDGPAGRRTASPGP